MEVFGEQKKIKKRRKLGKKGEQPIDFSHNHRYELDSEFTNSRAGSQLPPLDRSNTSSIQVESDYEEKKDSRSSSKRKRKNRMSRDSSNTRNKKEDNRSASLSISGGRHFGK